MPRLLLLAALVPLLAACDSGGAEAPGGVSGTGGARRLGGEAPEEVDGLGGVR